MKKSSCWLLTFLIVISVFSCFGMAQGEFTLWAPVVEAAPGDLVQVPITISGNPGIISVKVLVGYQSSVLSLVNLQAGDIPGVTFSPLENNPVTVNFMDALHGNHTTNGVLALFTFQVKETITYDVESPISLQVNSKDVFDTNFKEQPLLVQNGKVQVKAPQTPVEPPVVTPSDTPTQLPQKGDVNGDGSIDAKDALMVLKIAVNKIVPTTLQQQLANVNQDSAINAKDALEILKYAVKKPSCLEK